MPKNRGAADWQIGDAKTAPAKFNVSSLFGMSGLTCVVTGGGSGIGSMIAAGFAGNGAKVYIVSRKDCSPLATELTTRGPGQCIALQADVAKIDSLKALAVQLQELEGDKGISVMVNNAGTNWAQPVEDFSQKGWDKVYDVNTRAVFFGTQVMIPLLTAGSKATGRRSVIINIGSVEGLKTPLLNTFSYSSGKAAVIHLTKVMAGKFGSEGRPININCISPGPFVSRMMRATVEMSGGTEAMGAMTATGRIGSPLDMAGVAIYLSSQAGQFVNGTNIVVDGGSIVMPHGSTHPNPRPLAKL